MLLHWGILVALGCGAALLFAKRFTFDHSPSHVPAVKAEDEDVAEWVDSAAGKISLRSYDHARTEITTLVESQNRLLLATVAGLGLFVGTAQKLDVVNTTGKTAEVGDNAWLLLFGGLILLAATQVYIETDKTIAKRANYITHRVLPIIYAANPRQEFPDDWEIARQPGYLSRTMKFFDFVSSWSRYIPTFGAALLLLATYTSTTSIEKLQWWSAILLGTATVLTCVTVGQFFRIRSLYANAGRIPPTVRKSA